MFIFSQRRRHSCRRAFSLLESVHRIAPPMQIDSHHTSLFWKLLHLMQNKSGRASTIPLNVYFFPTQTARLPQGVFSTRICASNYFASVKPIRKAATSTKSKAVQFSPIPLDVYFLPTQTARLPQGVFSTRICALNCFASVKSIRKATTSNANKSGRASTIPLNVYFLPTQTAQLPHGVFSTRICASNRSASADNSNLANLSGKLLHPRKAKRQRFHPYRLTFIFSQRRRHGCRRAFSLLESVRRIAPPMRTHGR